MKQASVIPRWCTVLENFLVPPEDSIKNISTRQLKNFNSADFIKDILSSDWTGIVSYNDDVNLAVEQLTSSFSLMLEKHASLREKRVSEKFCPWLTKDLKLMSVDRDKLKKQAARSNSEILMQAHRQMSKKVNKLNTEFKRKYFSNKISSHKGDLKNTWKAINLLLSKKSKTTRITSLDADGKQVCDNKAIAESMNDLSAIMAKTSVTNCHRQRTSFLKVGFLLTSIICGLNFKL